MKHLHSLAIVLMLIFSVAATSEVNSALPTNVRFTVLTRLGTPVENAKVVLYATREDYDKEENPLAGPEFTDAKGRATFKSLDEKVYFVQVTKGDANNYGDAEETSKLIKGRTNKFNIIIE